jgi:serine/threonine protein kinase
MHQEVFLTPGYLAVATEFADGGGLADFQQRVENAGGMAEGPARALFQQMALALSFCHARGVTLGGFDLAAWLLDRAPARPILTRQQSSGGLVPHSALVGLCFFPDYHPRDTLSTCAALVRRRGAEAQWVCC